MNVVILLFVIAYLIAIFSKKRKVLMKYLDKYLGKHSIKYAFIVALSAMLGSLFYSEIMHYTPCEMCWYQRILMYPLTLLLFIAIIKKDKGITKYVVPMSIIGAILSGWHYIIQRYTFASTCSIDAVVPCTAKYTFAFGYITIPIMALTAFILIIFLSLIWSYSKKRI